MTLRHVADVSVADWLTSTDAPWNVLVSDGPAGFEAYARIGLPELGSEQTERDLYRHITDTLAGRTRTTDSCFFALWDGWGEIDSSQAEALMHATGDQSFFGRFFFPDRPPQVPPAFDVHIMDAPRLELGEREYFLFSGSLDQAGQWGAKPIAADWPPREISIPNLAWPADRAWFIAADPEAEWISIAGSEAAIRAIESISELQVQRTEGGTS